MARAKDNEGDHSLPLDLIGSPDDGRLGDGGVADKRTLDLGGTEAVAGDVEDIVDATDDPEVTFLVASGSVTSEVGSLNLAPVLFPIAGLVAPDAAEHRGPRLTDDKLTTLPMRDFFALIIDDCRVDSKKRQGRSAGLARGRTGQRSNHMSPGLGLPPCIDDGAFLVADVLVEPHPGLGVDRLADRTEQAKRGEIVLLEIVVAPLHEGSYGRRSGVEDGDPILGDQLPESVGFGPVRGSLIHEAGGAVGEGAVDEVTMTGDPANVGGAPVDILLLQVEDVLGGCVGTDEIAARSMEDSFRFSCRSTGVEDEERMLAIEMLCRAVC